MASSNNLFFSKPNYIYPHPQSDPNTFHNNDNAFEFHESDLYDLDHQPHLGKSKSKSISRLRRNPVKLDHTVSENRKIEKTGSLPVNIPDWSKILKSEYKNKKRVIIAEDYYSDDDDDEEMEDEEVKIPPHEYVARRRGSSLSVSVHEDEGVVGGTPKGRRDLTRLRDAIWEKTGFLH